MAEVIEKHSYDTDIVYEYELIEEGILVQKDSCWSSEDMDNCHEHVKLKDGRVAYICTYTLECEYGDRWKEVIDRRMDKQ